MIVLKNVLVATDFGAASDAALVYGRALAQTFGASLHLLHVAENQFLRPIPTDTAAMRAAYERSLSEQLTAATDLRFTPARCSRYRTRRPTRSSTTRAERPSISSSWARTGAARCHKSWWAAWRSASFALHRVRC
jgi:universal stress protein family protein